MRRFLSVFSLVLVLLMMPGLAGSATVVDLYGDKDGFGVGVLPNDEYTSYITLFKDDPEDVGTFTDEWIEGDQVLSHTYDISGLGSVESASLEIFSLGQGWHGLTQIYVDDNYIGDLTDGDDSGGALGTNYARLDVFDLTSYASLLTGANILRIDTAGTNTDDWALDYSELTINTVPIPGAIWLVGSGLVGLITVRRKK